MGNLIYLDNNATTMVDKKVFEAMEPYFCEQYANPSSMYTFGATAAKAVKEAREKMRAFFNAKSINEVFFTGSGSEGANTAIRGYLAANKGKKHIITTKVEHPCVLNTFKELEQQGYRRSEEHTS